MKIKSLGLAIGLVALCAACVDVENTGTESNAGTEEATEAASAGGMCGEPLIEGIRQGEGACTNDDDICIVGVESWEDRYAEILEQNMNTVGAPEPTRVGPVLRDEEGVSDECTACWVMQLECATDLIVADISNCLQPCVDDPSGEVCLGCQAPCFDSFEECAGLAPSI